MRTWTAHARTLKIRPITDDSRQTNKKYVQRLRQAGTGFILFCTVLDRRGQNMSPRLERRLVTSLSIFYTHFVRDWRIEQSKERILLLLLLLRGS